MNKDINDYIHLYLGCEILFDNKIWTLDKVGGRTCKLIRVDQFNKFIEIYPSQGKLILRPISDMTNDEWKEFEDILGKDFSKMIVIDSASKEDSFVRICHTFNGTAYMLSKQFDLFGLIDAGFAIDKTKIK